MKKVIGIFALVSGGIVLLAAVGVLSVTMGMGEIRALSIRDIDLARVNDGTYTGSYHKARWTYDVEVTVKDHRIVDVKNTNPRMRGLQALNGKIAEAIIARQSPKVDAVAKATINTRSFGKAVENALTSAVK